MAVTLCLLAWCLHSESTLHRYEVHPYRALPVGPGPEFKTTLRVRSWRGLGILGVGVWKKTEKSLSWH